jgi:hypothetical protein
LPLLRLLSCLLISLLQSATSVTEQDLAADGATAAFLLFELGNVWSHLRAFLV